MSYAHAPRGSRPGGFTLVELLVSLAILVLILVGVLQLFDANTRLARVQTNLAEAQQSLRVGQYSLVRTVRMAGRGTIPARLFRNVPNAFDGKLLPGGLAIEVENNVPANTLIAGPNSPIVAEGTDILTVRGVIDGSIYQIDPAGSAFVLDDPDDPRSGSVTILDTTPTGVPQDLRPLADAIDAGHPIAILLVSPLDDVFAVVEFSSGDDDGTATTPPTVATLNFNVGDPPLAENYLDLSPGGVFPDDLRSVAFVGLLEEYRFYVREDPITSDLANAGAGPVTRLSRARVYPNNDEAFAGNEANLREDIADNVRDLQVALGIDTNGNEQIEEDPVNPTATDDWLFNILADDEDDETLWNGTATDPRRIYYVRISTLVRTDRPDTRYVSPPIARIEDRIYNEPAAPANEAERRQRFFRRRQLTTVVDLRNLS